MLFEDERRDLLELKRCEAGKSARSTQPSPSNFLGVAPA